MKKIYVLFLLLLTSLVGMAQSDYLPKVIPPSPTSDAFRQYGGYTPSLSSGKINIPIPLYNLQVKELNIPFTLSYSTSGINIQDQPYPAGYGWVFSPGLRVSRTILGRSDDQFPVRSLTGNEDVNTQKAAIVGVNEFSHHFLQASDLYDIQNDIFTVHLPNGSYTFMIERSGETYEAVSVGNLLKIEFYMNKAVQHAGHPSSINGLKITDENGIIYKFGMYEDENIINKYVELSLSENGITTWALRQIILPGGDNINFTWKEVRPVSYQIEVSNSIHITDKKEVLCGSEPGYTATDVGGLVQFIPYTKVLVLDKIEFPLGSVDFAYKADHDPFISNFLVKNKLGNTIKSINFKYGDNYQDAPLLKELAMDGLEYGPKYRFKYNELRYDKNTRALDFWGFYNGKESNPTLIPEMSIRIYNTTENFVDSYGKGDRSTDPFYMQAYMLTSIEYPTGGYSEFEYEPHKFADQHPLSTDAFNPAKYIPPLNTGAGLRVSKITDYPSLGGIPVIKKYKYGITENGLGNILYSPTLDTFVDEYVALSPMPCEGGITSPPFGLRYARELNINALSNYKKYIIFDRPVWYNMVTEYTDDGKVEYYFENNTDYIGQISPVDLFRSTFISYYSSLFDDGPRLKKKIVYKKENLNYQPLEETITEYKKFGFMNISNYFLLRQIIPGDSSDPDFTFREPGRFPSNPYSRIPYQISVNCHKPESRQVTLYSGGVPLISKEDYIYNPYMQVSQQIKYLNNSKELDTDFKYPYDSQGSVYQSMLDQNILAPVIEKTTTYNDIKSEHVKTDYFSDPIKTNGLILPEKIQTSLSADETLRTDIVFDRYDKQGNILQYTTLGGSKVSYLWGYNGQYPIAEIRNADYSEIVPALITESSVKSIAEKNEPSVSDWSLIESIRSSLPQAQVTTYTHYPLIGIASITDPRGQVTKYDYDWEGRLYSIYLEEDGRDKIIKRYHYDMPGYIYLKDTESGGHIDPKPEPIDPENLTPDPYKKGKFGSIFLNIEATGNGSYGTKGWNYDVNTVRFCNVIQKSYKTIEIGEYIWTTENVRLKYTDHSSSISLNWINFTQADIDKLSSNYLSGRNIPLEEFEQVYGTWVTLYDDALMYRNITWGGRDVEGGLFLKDWGLPTKEDIWQLYGQAPRTTDNFYNDIKDFLFASPSDFNFGWTQGLFKNKNISGLTLTPLGMRESNQGGAIYGFGQVTSLQTSTWAAIETLSDRDLSGKSGLISNPYSYHFTQARHRRPLTDQELGYKMYIDAANDQILMLPYDQVSILPELPKGLERGVALRYANRKAMAVVKKWSEIQVEATQIMSTITKSS